MFSLYSARFITPLPQFLRNAAHLDQRRDEKEIGQKRSLRAVFLGPLDHELGDRPAERQSHIDVAAKVNTGPEPRLAGFVSQSVQINGVAWKEVSEDG